MKMDMEEQSQMVLHIHVHIYVWYIACKVLCSFPTECGTQYSGNVCVADSLSPSLAVTDTPTMKSSDSSLPATCTLTTVSSTALSSTSSSLPLSNAMATLSIPTEPSLSTSTQNRSPPTATPFSLTSTGDIPTSTSLAPTLPTVTLSASDREIQEAASFLASLAESHTLSPLHLLPQQQQSPVAHTDTAVNPVSSAGTTSSAAGISGIYRVVQSNPYHQEVSAVSTLSVYSCHMYMYTTCVHVHVFCHTVNIFHD